HGHVAAAPLIEDRHHDVPGHVSTPALPGAELLIGRVRHDPVEPGAEGRLTPEAVDLPDHGPECVLHDFFCILPVRRLRDEVADGVRFAFQTGWRRAEVFSLSWSQVDWSGGFVRLEPGMTKNGEGRAFPITPALRALLERRQEYTRRCERAQTRIIPLVLHRTGAPVK